MNLKLIAVIVLCLSLAAGFWLSYQAGANSEKLKTQKVMDSLNAQSEKSKRESDNKTNEIELERVKDQTSADRRFEQLRKKLQAATRSGATRHDPVVASGGAGDDRCGVSDTVVGLLSEATSDPRIPKTDHPTGFVSAETAVTTDHLAAYGFYTIEQYNNCAADYNTLIKMVE